MNPSYAPACPLCSAILEAEPHAYIYHSSPDSAQGTACAMVRIDGEKRLAVQGEKAAAFSGQEKAGVKFCPLTVENAALLMELFPYTAPVSHQGHPFTMGLGDRLGLATPGHIRAIAPYEVFPVFAQQSIRELTLTGRTFRDVIAAAAFGVFQEGYKGGYGADGDHLKTTAEIQYALESGCSMITLDCSEHIDIQASAYTEQQVNDAYAALPQDLRTHYEARYLDKELPIVGRICPVEYKGIVLVFYKAIRHAEACWQFIQQTAGRPVDFELSIDETRTVTTPAEHFIVANELASVDVHPVSVAPHFSGEFEKGIEYQGDLNAFARDFKAHQQIADHFGYKLSLHSGSDKFSVFHIVGSVTGCHVHVKTAGTNWLEALRVVARRDPQLYRQAHKYALEHREEALKYYHVTTDPNLIPNIDLESDAYLPEYLQAPSSRQAMHIAYGLLLNQEWFSKAFFPLMAQYEEEYYAGLVAHIGRHLSYLTSK